MFQEINSFLKPVFEYYKILISPNPLYPRFNVINPNLVKKGPNLLIKGKWW